MRRKRLASLKQGDTVILDGKKTTVILTNEVDCKTHRKWWIVFKDGRQVEGNRLASVQVVRPDKKKKPKRKKVLVEMRRGIPTDLRPMAEALAEFCNDIAAHLEQGAKA